MKNTFLISRRLYLSMRDQQERENSMSRIRDVLAQLPSLRVAYVYGSFLSRDDFRDIDIALLVDEEVAKGDDPAYASHAADLLGQSLGFRPDFDVRVINAEPAWFRYEVISSGVPVYVRNEEDRIDFETGVLLEYQDIKFMYDLFDREYLAKA